MNKNKQWCVTGVFSAAFLLSGCGLLSHAPTQRGDTAEAPPAEQRNLQPAASGTELTLSWTGYRAMLYLPDPEHKILEAEPPSSADLNQLQNTDQHPNNTAVDDEPDDLWDRLRNGFAFPEYDNRRVEAELAWYINHPDYLARTVERARPYLFPIVETLERRGIPQEIALLPIVESAFQPFAYSHGRAAGLWQFIPSTANHFGLKQNWWYDGRRDVLASTDAAMDYLELLNKRFDGDWLLALAAYNSGSGTVARTISDNRKAGRPADFWSLNLPRETRAYVPKLLALARIFATPEAYGIELAGVPDEPIITLVNVGSQIDLAVAAELAEISLEELYRLNPAFNRWATDPEGPHELLLPVDKAAGFSIRLAQLDDGQRITWTRHRIREGETLGHIAAHYDTTVGVLRQVNDIRGYLIRAGQSLIIPVSIKDLNAYTLSAQQRKKAIQNTVRDGERVVHTVRSGDTLWDLARKYRVSVDQIANWNAMSPRDMLRPGQRLVIWRQAGAAAVDFEDLLNGAHPLNTVTRRINYVVRRGDSLARISQLFNVGISELRTWNALSPDTYLQPGQRLTLYVDVTRQNGNI